MNPRFRDAGRVASGAFVAPQRERNVTQLPETIAVAATDGRQWTVAKLESGARVRGHNAEGRLLALFDTLDDVINRADREARAFVLSLASPASVGQVRDTLHNLAGETELRDVPGFVSSAEVLFAGVVALALVGDLDAANRAQVMARELVLRHQTVSATEEPIVEVQPKFDQDDDLDSYLDWQL